MDIYIYMMQYDVSIYWGNDNNMPAPELMELNVVTDSPYVKLIRFNKMFKSTKDITVKFLV